jgi:hypothetical protein
MRTFDHSFVCLLGFMFLLLCTSDLVFVYLFVQRSYHDCFHLPSTNDTKPSASKAKESVKRLIWAKTDVTISKDGKQTFAYPFLLDSNVMEKCYLQHMIVLKPFAATYGNLETEWVDMVQDINSKVGDDGKPIFSPPLVVHTAKDRLKEYVKFANLEHSHILKSTGYDNMPTSCSPLEGLS